MPDSFDLQQPSSRRLSTQSIPDDNELLNSDDFSPLHVFADNNIPSSSPSMMATSPMMTSPTQQGQTMNNILQQQIQMQLLAAQQQQIQQQMLQQLQPQPGIPSFPAQMPIFNQPNVAIVNSCLHPNIPTTKLSQSSQPPQSNQAAPNIPSQIAFPTSSSSDDNASTDNVTQCITTPLMETLFGGPKGTSNTSSISNSKKRPSDSDLSTSSSSKRARPGLSNQSQCDNSFGGQMPTLLGKKLTDVVDIKGSFNDGTRKYAYQTVVGSSDPSKIQRAPVDGAKSPQDHLDDILQSRKYSTEQCSSFDCGYPSQPTALQRSSYGTAVLRAVQRSNSAALSTLLRAGVSPNPCNAHGDSVLQMVCKRADFGLFQTLLNHGASVEVADAQFGRTPLHHAAWAPASDDTFHIVTKIFEKVGCDILRITDKSGKTPLQYLTVDKWPKWIAFLDKIADIYFPKEDSKSSASGPPQSLSSKRSEEPTEDSDIAILDPPNCLAPEVAALVASGKVPPEKARDHAINVTPEVSVLSVQSGRGSSPCA